MLLIFIAADDTLGSINSRVLFVFLFLFLIEQSIEKNVWRLIALTSAEGISTKKQTKSIFLNERGCVPKTLKYQLHKFAQDLEFQKGCES